MRFKREGPVAVVDLHGVYEREARMLLEGWLNQAPEEVQELRVIHGYQRGTVLRDMVREEFAHPRVAVVLPSLNPGETRLLLRNPGKEKRTGPQTHGKKRGR
ncbi:MAG TPA: Smr/MutS family protein [Candidatus Acutalibacter pullicola]|uniref:Smr/MutS family protein n=1 Tax=Candidatus Acutalibacter pullicola TaxID=2838417 RepID=A0A9D2MVJ7_9FIRM|nr:Smr/MutS family protein [Candidatus Acutalibacter pullicola]